jgi:hypothetical protein
MYIFKSDRFWAALILLSFYAIAIMLWAKVPANGVFAIPFGIIIGSVLKIAFHSDKKQDVRRREEEWQREARFQNEQNMKKALGL